MFNTTFCRNIKYQNNICLKYYFLNFNFTIVTVQNHQGAILLPRKRNYHRRNQRRISVAAVNHAGVPGLRGGGRRAGFTWHRRACVCAPVRPSDAAPHQFLASSCQCTRTPSTYLPNRILSLPQVHLSHSRLLWHNHFWISLGWSLLRIFVFIVVNHCCYLNIFFCYLYIY